MARRRPEFKPGSAGGEAAQLEQVERCSRVLNSVAGDDARTDFSITSGISIHGLGSSGEGVGSVDGYVVFVDGALPGEEVVARLVECRKRHGFAELLSISKPSPDRVEPPCKLFGRCGGCQLMHLSYAKQLEIKRQRVIDALSRIGHLEGCDVAPCLPSPQPLAYRNKIQLPIRAGKLGFYARSSHDLIPVDTCLIHCSLGEEVYQKVRSILQRSPTEDLRHVLIKSAVNTGEALVVLVARAPLPPSLAQEILASHPSIRGVVQNLHEGSENVILGPTYQVLAGEGFITEKLAGLTFKVSPASFFQINPAQAERLYAKALEYAQLTGRETVLDAYCGVGTLSLCLAKQAKAVIGVECVPDAIADARENARVNGIQNATFVCAATEDFIKQAPAIDIALLNPPRKGCERSVLEEIGRLAPKRLIYISCDPATLARDLAHLCTLGYAIDVVQPFDMFAQTAHVECVVKLTLDNFSEK